MSFPKKWEINQTRFYLYSNTPDARNKTSEAFTGFADKAPSVAETIATLKQLIPNEPSHDEIHASLESPNAYDFFILVYTKLMELKPDSSNKNLINKLFHSVKKLIKDQKTAIQTEIAETKQKTSHTTVVKTFRAVNLMKKYVQSPERKQRVAENIENKAQARARYRKQVLGYATASALTGMGLGLTGFSGLMQYHATFALTVGIHLPPVALAVTAVTGTAMIGLAVYAAYRTYQATNPNAADSAAQPTAQSNVEPVAAVEPAAPTPGVVYSKTFTAALLTTGLGLASFSALTAFSPQLLQFSPKFALLIGLHLSPAALITTAALGLLLVSVALYRMCKTSAPAPTAEVSAKDEPKVNCIQRLSQYAFCCFNIGRSRAPAGVVDPGHETVRSETMKR